jgi:tetratricopeptide (TPR) repeat protein
VPAAVIAMLVVFAASFGCGTAPVAGAAPGTSGASVASDSSRVPARMSPGAAALARANRLIWSGQVPRGIALLDSIERAARRSKDAELERTAVYQRGIARTTIGDLPAGEADLEHAIALAEAAVDSGMIRGALGRRASAVMFQGRFAEAAGMHARVIPLAAAARDTAVEAWSQTGHSYCLVQMGDVQGARRGYRRALELFRVFGDPEGELYAMVGLGIAELQVGAFDAASARYRDVIRRSRSLGQAETEAQAWNNLGSIEFQRGDPALAAQYYGRAVEIHRGRGQLREIVTAQHNVAVARMEMGRLDEAVALLDSARVECERRGFLEARARVLHQIGHARLLQGRAGDALASAREALAGSERLSVELRARALGDLSRALLALGRPGEAYDALTSGGAGLRDRLGVSDRATMDAVRVKALIALGRHRDAVEVATRGDREAEAAGLGNHRLLLLSQIAWCRASLGDTMAALGALERAGAVWERQRAVPRDPEWRAERGARGRGIYALRAVLELARPGAPLEARAERAFDVVQPFKARTLHERTTGPGGAGETAGPRPAISLRALQGEVLQPGELLLDVFLGTDRGVLFAVTRERCRAVLLPGGEVLDPRLRDLRDLLGTRGGRAEAATLAETAARGVGRIVFGDVADMIRDSRRVLVAPDGALNLVPLAMLVGAAAGTEREVAAVPSSTLLAALRETPPDRGDPAGPALLAIGTGDAARGPTLAGVAWEVAMLRDRFDGVAVRAALDSADRRGLDGQILHVAGHALVDDQRPWRSQVRLGRSADGTWSSLSAAEIATRRLRARLAVLAGCETAGGRVLSGEGVQGLTAAFIGSGVPAVVASLWPVDDRATARLVEALYDELARGRPAAAALKAAQQQLRRHRSTAQPADWAGFVLVGNPDVTVRLARRTPWAVLASVAAILGLIGTWAAFRRAPRRTGDRRLPQGGGTGGR